MTCGIYTILNTASGAIYVGHSCHIERRWRHHRSLLRRGIHHSPKLQNAWSKHGEAAFAFLVTEECDPNELVTREQFYFEKLRPTMNVAEVAGSRLGVPQSEETKQKIRQALIGRERTQETCKRLSAALRGRRLSADHCAKISQVKRNTSAETRAKISAANKGRSISDAARRKISEAMKGRKLSEDHRAKISTSLKGREFSEETRAKMSRANNSRGRTHSEETKAKIRASALRREALKRSEATGEAA